MSFQISNAVITGGSFSSTIQQTTRSAIERLEEAVARSAFHNSGERFDPPRCHPNTRVAVQDKAKNWALRLDPDTRDAPIFWLTGPAGAGKSAIAQTLAEHFHSNHHLIASFFFARSDPTRNHARFLVATIAYQVYTLLPPLARDHLLSSIDRDPLIFAKSLLVQFEALVVNPLLFSAEHGYRDSIDIPNLIIVDGLDECGDQHMQREVLLMLLASVRQSRFPFRFLLASRPELDIRTLFNAPEFAAIHISLFLDDVYLPDLDIELYLRDKFEECKTTHPFRHLLPPDWPSDTYLTTITTKSSGQFIYASVVAKYVMSTRHRPDRRLETVLNLTPTTDLPFAELDRLYTQILSEVQDIETVLRIISLQIPPSDMDIACMECVLELSAGDLSILICDLASLIGIQPEGDRDRLVLFHASLSDYLCDYARSREYHIDIVKHRAANVLKCMKYLSHFEIVNGLKHAPAYVMTYVREHGFSQSTMTAPLRECITAFSIPRAYCFSSELSDGIAYWVGLTIHFLPQLFRYLKRTNSVTLLRQHQTQYDALLRNKLDEYPVENTILVLALIAAYRHLPRGAFRRELSLFEPSQLGKQDLYSLQLDSIYASFPTDYSEDLSDFLNDATRSQKFHAGPNLYAQASKQCLLYISDHASFAPHRMLQQQCQMRKYNPWKWNRRRHLLGEDVRGPRVTPWLWTCRPDVSDVTAWFALSETYFRNWTPHKPVFVYYPDGVYIGESEIRRDPVLSNQIKTEKFYLALTYLNYFLPRAGKLDDLVRMCERLTLASRCQIYPRESAQARSHMHAYATQYGQG